MGKHSIVGRILVPAAVGAALSFFGYMPLLGLPGALFLQAAGALFGLTKRLSDMGPGVWGLAIFVTWCAGIGVPAGCWLLWAIRAKTRVVGWIAAGFAGYAVMGLATAVATILEQHPS